MTALVIVCAVAMAALAALATFALHQVAATHSDIVGRLREDNRADRHAWERERNELLTRIQHPHLVPAPLPVAPLGESSGGDEPSADPYDDEFHLVGKILSGPVNDDGTPVREAA